MGFDDAIRRLRELQRRAEALDGEHAVPMSELFNDEFMLRNTEFTSMGAMFSASGFEIETQDDFAALPADQWDMFVRERTRFSSWRK